MADRSLRFRVIADSAQYDAAMAKAGSSTGKLAGEMDKAARESEQLTKATIAARSATLDAAGAARTAAAAQDKSATAAKRAAAAQTEAAAANKAAAEAAQKLENGEIDAATAQRLSTVAARRDADAQRENARAEKAAADAAEKVERASLKAAAAQLAQGHAAETAGKKSERSSGLLNKAFEKLVSGALKEGQEAGELFGDGLSGAIKTISKLPPEISIPILVGAATLTAGAAAEIGAAAGGAIVGGIGAAGIGVAIASQIHDPHVQSALATLKADAKSELKAATAPFAGGLVYGLTEADAMVHRLGPSWKRSFGALESPFENLSDGAVDMVENLMPGIEAVARSAAPVINGLANQLPVLGDDLTGFLEDISADTQGASEAVSGLIMLFRVGLAVIGPTIAGAEVTMDRFISTLNAAYTLLSKIPGTGAGLAPLKAALMELQGTGDRATRSAHGLGGALDDTAKQAKKADTAVADLNSEFDELLGGAVDAKRATLEYKDSLAALTQAVHDNGTSLSNNTAKGRANQRSLLDIVDAAKRARDAYIDEHKSTDGVAQATVDANRKFRQQIHTLLDQADKLGLNTGRVRGLLVQLGLLPHKKSTSVQVPGASQSAREVQILRQRLAGLHDKYITVWTTHQDVNGNTIHHVEGWNGGGSMRADGGVIDYYAAGGFHDPAHVAQIVPAGSWRVFGEPETGGEAYIPLATSKRARSIPTWLETGRRLGIPMAAGGGSSGPSADAIGAATARHLSGPLGAIVEALAAGRSISIDGRELVHVLADAQRAVATRG